MGDEGHFEALVQMFCQALKTFDTLPQTQRPAVLVRQLFARSATTSAMAWMRA